ncbi:glycoside hydrolase superfamily, partial [Mycena epipterygia]
YPPVLQNRAFQQVTPGTSAALNGWSLLTNGQISVVKSSSPPTPALPNVLSLTVPAGTTGITNLSNSGYGGVPMVEGTVYTASFLHRTVSPLSTNISSHFAISFPSFPGGTDGTSSCQDETAPFNEEWQQTNFSCISLVSGNRTFVLMVPPDLIAGKTMELTMFTFFPPTFKGRANGMRLDISNALLAVEPAFFRFPGGNSAFINLHTATRWDWRNTIGPLVNRPGRQGVWGYINTDGLGLYEYLQWIEDMEMEPIMAVWAGYSLDGDSIPQSALTPFVQDAIDQINFAIGDASSNPLAAMRASMGHPTPFNLRYIEIGNEDFRSPNNTYNSYRWESFFNALQGQFPQLTYIATSAELLSTIPLLIPPPRAWDLHVYASPSMSNIFFLLNFFRTMCFQFDVQPRNGVGFLMGEYQVATSDNGFALPYPTIDGSIAEAAYMTGLDRNSDIVFAASYARLLNPHCSETQVHQSPSLISFTINSTILSTSYYVQQMFSQYIGDTYLNSTTNSAQNAVQWSVTKNTVASEIYLKVTNTGTIPRLITFTLPFTILSSTGAGIVLTAPSGTMNTPTDPNAAVPQSFTFVAGETVLYAAPALSASVLIVSAR